MGLNQIDLQERSESKLYAMRFAAELKLKEYEEWVDKDSSLSQEQVQTVINHQLREIEVLNYMINKINNEL